MVIFNSYVKLPEGNFPGFLTTALRVVTGHGGQSDAGGHGDLRCAAAEGGGNGAPLHQPRRGRPCLHVMGREWRN